MNKIRMIDIFVFQNMYQPQQKALNKIRAAGLLTQQFLLDGIYGNLGVIFPAVFRSCGSGGELQIVPCKALLTL